MNTIYWAGDSTVAYNSFDTYPQTGIGQAFTLFVKDGISIRNKAVNGRSTKSFIDEGRLAEIDSTISEGDYLFIQFGHNDEKIKDPSRYTNPGGSFSDNLRLFIKVAQSHNAHPLLIAPLERRHFDSESMKTTPTHTEYRLAVLQTAEEEHVPVIDLTTLSAEYMNNLGPEASKELFVHVPAGKYAAFPDGKEDNTHLRYHGAVMFAHIIAQQLKNIYPELFSDK